jgi:mannose/cellobiose epimerase-like protein (N-acyl-D-glucosamine 2-epimerase family)
MRDPDDSLGARGLLVALACAACLHACASQPEPRGPAPDPTPVLVAGAATVPVAPGAAGAPAADSDQSSTNVPEAEPAPADPVALLPDTERWRTHVTAELLPFWTHPDALGTPPGNFPTFRCNDGSAYRPAAPCPELARAPAWLASELGTEYTRMKSRQAFVYGAAFHITGDPALLAHARAGVDYLRRHAYEPTGSAVSWWRAGKPGPPAGQRTAQDLAYAQLGLAFYYYLTRDPDVLADLLRLEQHLFSTYLDPAAGMLRWVREAGAAGQPEQQELVAQLDQLNAYLLLLAPLLDEPHRARWHGYIATLARTLRERFWAPEHGLFWGAIHEPARRALGTHHTDFGHSVKSLWMLYLAGRLLMDGELANFAKRGADALIARAFQPSGCWAAGVDADDRIQPDSNWWTSAELDQTSATLALVDRTHARYLASSYACWLERFVDPVHHEVWPFVSADWPEDLKARVRPPKLFHWKNGYHAMEHALVALITTAALRGEPLALHFAFRQRPAAARIQPYLFQGRIAQETPISLPGLPGDLQGVRIVFRDLR